MGVCDWDCMDEPRRMLIDSERSDCSMGEKEMGMAELPGDTMGGRAANTER